LIEVKNIIETTPANPVVITSQDVFKYPTIIQLKVLNKFSPYYATVYKKYSPTPQQPAQEALTPNEKKLKILQKLQEEWELAPKKNEHPTALGGSYIYLQPAGEVRISQTKFSMWMRECGMDWYELESILIGFRQEGLIIDFDNKNEFA
jgi:hypothetical protein